MYSSKYAGMVAPYACHQPFALVSRASAASASVVGPSAPYSSHMARTSTARTAVRPLSIRHSLGPDHSSAAAAAPTVTAASSRSFRRRYARDLARDAEGRWMNEELGPALRRLRIGKGYTQRSVADKLCEQAGLATVTRHEVSRWERQLRLP